MKKFLTIVLLATLSYGCDKLDDESRVKDVVTIMDDSVFINYCLLNFDLNNDGAISQTEAKTVKVIEITDEPKLKSVKGISAFSNLEEIHFEKTGLQSIDLSKNTKLTTIKAKAFYDCSSLTSVTIGNNVTEIGSYAFYNCSRLYCVTIGNGVTLIYPHAFSECTNLNIVYCKPITPPLCDSYTFMNTTVRYIYVPSSSKELYEVADGWSQYSKYIYGHEFE